MGQVLPFKTKKGRPQLKSKSRHRLALIFAFLIAFLLAIAGHLVTLQVLEAEKLDKKAKAQHQKSSEILAKRGIIADRNGNILAQSLEVVSIGVSPFLVKRPQKTARILAPLLKQPQAEIFKKLTGNNFAYLKRKADQQTVKSVKKAVIKENLTGIEFDKESKRFYPYGNLFANITGFAGIDNNGLEGLELYYDQKLKGRNGKLLVEQNDFGHLLPGGTLKYKRAKNGKTLITTIDKEIQYKAKVELNGAMKKWSAKAGWLVVMEVPSGDILSMVSLPSYNSNKFSVAKPEQKLNRTIGYSYEPGSTMKVITVAAGLEEGKFNLNNSFFLPSTIKVDGYTVKDAHHREGKNFTVAEILTESSNVGAATLSQLLGKNVMYKYIKAFGISEKTGIDLPGEEKGLLPPLEQWRGSTLATVAYGQGVAATAIQMVRVMGIIANDGQEVKPHVGKAIIGSKQKSVNLTPKSSKFIITKTVAQQLREVLQKAVTEGTGKAAQIKGYTVGGKTGTAQKVVNGRYQAKYISSFVGLAPVTKPKLVALVALDEPEAAYYGGTVAAPVFAKVVEFSLQKLGVTPDATTTDLE